MGNASAILGATENARERASPRKINVARNMHLDRVFPINISYKNSSDVDGPPQALKSLNVRESASSIYNADIL